MESLPRKLGVLGQDIIRLLKDNEPEMLMWRELRNILWENYKSKYKDIKSFGVALTNKLTSLRADGHIKKEGDFYGTGDSKPPTRDLSLSQIKNEVKKIKEDYVNGFIDNAFKRLVLLLEANNGLQKKWKDENEGLFSELIDETTSLERELKIIRSNPIEYGNFQRQKRIREHELRIKHLKAKIIFEALRQWT